MEKPKRIRKIPVILKGQLQDRAQKWASIVGLDLPEFVNQLVEGGINRMESDKPWGDIPVLQRARILEGKSWLDSSLIDKFFSMVAPKTHAKALELEGRHYGYLSELVKKHDGPLTKEIWDRFWERAVEQNQLRAEAENFAKNTKK